MKHWRLNLIFVVLLLFGAAIISRLFYLQVQKGDFYKALAQGQQGVFEEVVGQRGDIFAQDKDGNLYTLATNRDVKYVYVSPAEIEEKEQTAQALSQILDIDKEEITAKILDDESLYAVIKQRISEEEEEAVAGVRLKGVYLQDQTIRYF